MPSRPVIFVTSTARSGSYGVREINSGCIAVFGESADAVASSQVARAARSFLIGAAQDRPCKPGAIECSAAEVHALARYLGEVRARMSPCVRSPPKPSGASETPKRTGGGSRRWRSIEAMTSLLLEILYFEGRPNHESARTLVERG
jgi:hypothetical protein